MNPWEVQTHEGECLLQEGLGEGIPCGPGVRTWAEAGPWSGTKIPKALQCG